MSLYDNGIRLSSREEEATRRYKEYNAECTTRQWTEEERERYMNEKRRGRPPKSHIQDAGGAAASIITEGITPAAEEPVMDLHPGEELDACWQKAAESGWNIPDDEPIPYELVKPEPAPEGIAEAVADIIYKFNREYERGYAAGKADAAKALMDALLKMGVA